MLIFFYDEIYKIWDYLVFEIKDKSFIKKPKEDNKKLQYTNKEGRFSICNVNEAPILYFCYIENDKFNIKLKSISTSLSAKTAESSTNDKTKLNLSEGNCVLNYFYHSFLKYPLIGALQYNYYSFKQLKNIYIFS